MASRHTPRIADWRIADGVRVEEFDGTWLALDAAGGVVYRLKALAADAVRHVAHRMPLPARLVPAARELAGHGVLEHPLVDRRTALVGAGVVTLTGLAVTILPSAARAASVVWTEPGGTDWPIAGGSGSSFTSTSVGDDTYHFHAFTTVGSNTLTVRDANAVRDVSVLVVGGGGGGSSATESAGAGGGAGALLSVSGGLFPLDGASSSYSLDVIVGAPGAGKDGTSTGAGADGGSSSLGAAGQPLQMTATGGGGGGNPGGVITGRTGGSGGGGGATSGTATNAGGGVGTVPTLGELSALFSRGSVTATEEVGAFTGGSGQNDDTGLRRRAGGGGGAGGTGGNGISGSSGRVAGNGGPALLVAAFTGFGAAGFFAGGGGGATGQNGSGTLGVDGAGAGGGGGAGQGGDGGTKSGTSAGANTGSGGGGACDKGNAGNGGSGVVIVRYRLAS
jgi:hypothetical protein